MKITLAGPRTSVAAMARSNKPGLCEVVPMVGGNHTKRTCAEKAARVLPALPTRQLTGLRRKRIETLVDMIFANAPCDASLLLSGTTGQSGSFVTTRAQRNGPSAGGRPAGAATYREVPDGPAPF